MDTLGQFGTYFDISDTQRSPQTCHQHFSTFLDISRQSEMSRNVNDLSGKIKNQDYKTMK